MSSAQICPLCFEPGFTPIGQKDGYRLVECGGCSLRYTNPMPSAQTISDYYATYWVNDKNIRYSARKIAKLKRILKPILARAGRTGEFLDIGCNTGFACEAARELGYSASGIDLSADAIEKAKTMYPGNQFEAASIQEFAKQNRQFDVVLCREVVEHLSELHSFFAALAACVRDGGLVHITTPDAGHFRVPRAFASWSEVIPPEHICFFNRRTLPKILAQYGFEVVNIQWKWKPSLRLTARKCARA